MEKFIEGGWGMWAIALFGVFGLVLALRYAARADARLRPSVESLARATLFFALSGFTTGIVATGDFVASHPEEPLGATIFQGVKESANNLALGFTLLALIHLAMAVGRRREAMRA